MPRSGFLTPSTFADLMTNDKTKTGLGKTAWRIVEQHALDILGVEREESSFTPVSCQWGIDLEEEAVETYQERTFRDVDHQPGFRISKTHPYVGGSMDGLINGISAGIEVKCPFNSIEHMYNLLEGRQLERDYKWQVQGYLWIYELDWIDFLSYDPRFPEPLNLYIKQVEPNATMRAALVERLELAHFEALKLVERMKDYGIFLPDFGQ